MTTKKLLSADNTKCNIWYEKSLQNKNLTKHQEIELLFMEESSVACYDYVIKRNGGFFDEEKVNGTYNACEAA